MRSSFYRGMGAACVAAGLTILVAMLSPARADEPAGECRAKGQRVVVRVQAGSPSAETRVEVGDAKTRWMIPDFWVLRMPQYEEAIGLSDEQKAKLQAISEDYRETMQAAYAGMREAKPEDRARLAAKAQEKVAAARKKSAERVKEVLTDEQLAKCEAIQLRVWAAGMLRSDRVREQLDLTEQQQKRLEQVFAKHRERTQRVAARQRELRQEANAEAIEVLTEEQVETLKQKQLERLSHHTYLLSPQHGGKELGLTEDQQTKIKEIGERWQEQMGELWQGVKEIDAEQRAEAMKQVREKTEEATAKMRAAIRDVLSAEQLEKAKEALFRSYGAVSLRYHARMPALVELTDKQREKIDAAYARVTEAGRKIGVRASRAYQKAGKQAVDLLTPEQIEKLKELRATWGKQSGQLQQKTDPEQKKD